MQKANFRCPQTLDEVFIERHTTVFKGDGTQIHKDRFGKQLVNANGVPLEHIDIPCDFTQGVAFVGRSIADQKIHNAAHFKSIAKKHSSSEEQKALKDKRFRQEFKLDPK